MSAPADRSPPWEDRRISTRIKSSSPPPSGSKTAAERLTDDLLVEILSRVPARSLCRFKCVSKRWLGLIDHPDHRKKLPRTLTGFYDNPAPVDSALRFTNVSGSRHLTHPAFLPKGCRVEIYDCCNGLLLCYKYGLDDGFCYLVCNPATEEWAELPPSGYSGLDLRLCFDPAVSPHFHVCLLVEDQKSRGYIDGVLVYSSQTGRWVHKERKWNSIIESASNWSNVYLNGSLHFSAHVNGSQPCLAALDMEGGARTNFRVPRGLGLFFIQLSQGCLHYAGFCTDGNHVDRLQVYVLTDYGGKAWTLKHSVETSLVFGGRQVDDLYDNFNWIAIHPQCNLIFFTVGLDITFMCYDMDRRQVKVIRDLQEVGERPYFPYVPLYEELPPLHK